MVESVYGEEKAREVVEASRKVAPIIKAGRGSKQVEQPAQLLLDYTPKTVVRQKAREDFIRDKMYPNSEEKMYVDSNGVVSFKLPDLKENVKEEVISIESEPENEEELATAKEIKEAETKKKVTEVKDVEIVKEEDIKVNDLKLPKNLTSKLKKEIPMLFNSYLQKFKVNIERRLTQLLNSTKDKNITARKQIQIDANKAKLEYINKVIFNYLETNSELVKINKFSHKKVLDGDKLFDKIIDNNEDMVLYMIQKQLEDKTNEIIVGINLMVEKKPALYNGYTVKRLINTYASEKGLDLKTYAGSILVKYAKNFDWSNEKKILAKPERTKLIKAQTKMIETTIEVVEKETTDNVNNSLERGEHNDGK